MIYKIHSADLEDLHEAESSNYQPRLLDVHVSLDKKNRELWSLAHHDAGRPGSTHLVGTPHFSHG